MAKNQNRCPNCGKSKTGKWGVKSMHDLSEGAR